MRSVRAAVWTLTALLLTAPGIAQEEPDERTDGEQEASDPAPEDRESPDVFIPTEEISEDASVPFPVDI